MDCQARRRKVRIIHRREGEHPRTVLPLSVVDNSPFSPIRLTVPCDSPYDQEALYFSHFKQRG
jgi:hypothetical protein